MKLYATRLEDEISDQEWQDLFSLVPAYRQEKIRLLRVRQDRERSLLAGLLLRKASMDNLGVAPEHFEFNSCGKSG